MNKHIKAVDSSKTMKICAVNCMTYLITNVINEAYLKFGELHNVEEKYRSRTNMKNEFLDLRLLMTKNKKSYASSIIMNEGKELKKPKIELKGLAIKKSNTNKYVSEYFTDILTNDILVSDEVNYGEIIGKYFNLGDEIEMSLNVGETKFYKPCRANDIASYAVPVNQMQVRGIMIWNLLFPDEEITLPNNVNAVKVIIEPDIDIVKNKIEEYVEMNKKIDLNNSSFMTELNRFLIKLESVIDFKYYNPKTKTDMTLLKNGIIDIISVPKNREHIPWYIIPFINTQTMVDDHLNSGTIILDCINVSTPKINDNLVPTNFIKI